MTVGLFVPLFNMAATHPGSMGVFVTDVRGAREYDAHTHVSQVFSQLRAKNALLEERSRQQGEQFLRVCALVDLGKSLSVSLPLPTHTQRSTPAHKTRYACAYFACRRSGLRR